MDSDKSSCVPISHKMSTHYLPCTLNDYAHAVGTNLKLMFAPFCNISSSPVSLYGMVLRVLHPASGVVCAEHNSHSIEDNKRLYTYGICRMVAETSSVTCLEHSYQPDAPNLTLIFCTYW